MKIAKLAPSHLRRVVRARKRWARLTLENRIGLFIRRWPMYGTAAAELGHLIGTLDVDCVLDVGAHQGGFGRLVRRLGFDGEIVSFEPASKAFTSLRRSTARDSRWVVHRLALGSEPATMELGIYEQTQLNSLRSPATEPGPVDARPTTVEHVEVARLDDVWAELVPTSRRVLLKIDAQGFDLEVLKGAERSLCGCVALQVEVSGVALYEGSPPLHEVITYLYDRDFRITGLFPILRSRVDRVQVVDFDATFVRVPVSIADRSPDEGSQALDGC